jgi:CRISPR-associated protein Cmr1
MEKIIFSCKTVTPLVMNGAYGNNDPELRPPGIKASLRFWWRALHGHLTLDQLREQEGKIFGNTKGRSQVVIRVEKSIEKYENVPLLEHRKGKDERETKKLQTWSDAIAPNVPFTVRIDFDEKIISFEKMKNLFILSCTLGGWGKRSRRGFGSVKVTEVDSQTFISPTTIDGIKEIIDKIVPNKFSKNSSSTEILTNHNPSSERGEYPEIWRIQIGKTTKSLRDIGQATHDTKFNSPNKQDYSKSLGDGRPRLASPVYVSILANEIPIITTLKKESWVNTTLQNELKSKIV